MARNRRICGAGTLRNNDLLPDIVTGEMETSDGFGDDGSNLRAYLATDMDATNWTPLLLAQNVVQPIVQRQLERNALDLHPIVGFGSTIIGSVLFGILGATLSAPTVAMVMRVRDRIQAFERGELTPEQLAELEGDGSGDAKSDDDPD